MDLSDSGRGYRYLPAAQQYSAGVRAESHHQLRRVQLDTPLPLDAGLDLARRQLAAHGVPPTGLCAVELRSPAAMTEAQFASLNREYRDQVDRLGALIGSANPVARTNVCPLEGAPSVPGVHAFTFVVPREGDVLPTFVISGSAEAPEGTDSYAEHAVAPGDTTGPGLAAKADWVLGEMERRLGAAGLRWSDCSEVNVYTRHRDRRTAASVAERVGPGPRVRWHSATPPVQGLDFEMDCRTVVTGQDAAAQGLAP